MSNSNKAIILSTVKTAGDNQMSLDLYLLDQTILKKEILFTLRFYLWDGDWISVGYHQKNIPNAWNELSAKGLVKIVKRPSGGGAVLHSGGITYAITFRKPEYKKFSYRLINNWLIKSFHDLGIILKNGTLKKAMIKENCFGTSYFSDLVDENGFKRIGSAQYWKQGSFLQHGEIQINPNNKLWLLIFGEEPPSSMQISLSKDQLIEYLKKTFLENYSNLSTKYIFLKHEDIMDYF